MALAQDARAETLTLAQAIEMGLQKSPSVAGARARTSSAEAGTGVARAGYFPTLSINAQGSYGSLLRLIPSTGQEVVRDAAGNPVPDPRNPTQAQFRTVQTLGRIPQTGPQIDTSASVRWTIFDFGRTPNNVGSANANYRSFAASEREATAQAAGEIASAYLTVYFQEKLFELAKATLESREKLFAIAKGLVKAGIQPPVEELRSQSRVESARRDQARAKAALEDARLGLSMLLGYDQPTPLRVTTPRLPKPPSEPASSIKEAEQKRATIAAAEESLIARKDAADAAEAAWFPSIFLLGSANLTYVFPEEFTNTGVTRNVTAGVGANWQLDLSIPARVEQANAEAAAAEAQLEETKRSARTEAARAAILVRMGVTQLEHAKRAEEATGQARAVIEARYVRGLSNPLELIDAEDSDLSARLTRLQTELDYSSSIVRLCVATGRPITDESSSASAAASEKSDRSDKQLEPLRETQ